MHLIILNYSIIIEEFVLIIKEVQGLVEILLIDILQLKNRHPLIYWSGKLTTQSYIWKPKKVDPFQQQVCVYFYIGSDSLVIS